MVWIQHNLCNNKTREYYDGNLNIWKIIQKVLKTHLNLWTQLQIDDGRSIATVYNNDQYVSGLNWRPAFTDVRLHFESLLNCVTGCKGYWSHTVLGYSILQPENLC